MSFANLYYLTIFLAVLPLPLYLIVRKTRNVEIVLGGFVLLVLATYTFGMLRSEGVDLDIYMQNFKGDDENPIPDIGFRVLMQLLNDLNLPFGSLMLLIGACSIWAVHRLARHFDVSFIVLLLFWYAHTMVVRDFAQTRIGFAFAILAIALTSRSAGAKWIMYLVAGTMHLTAFAFVAAYESCRQVANIERQRTRTLLVATGVGAAFTSSLLLEVAAMFDPRIGIYLAWEAEGYGTPASTFGTLVLHGAVMGAAIFFRKVWQHDPRFRTVFYLEVLGVAVFFALSDLAIFAFRLSNLLTSLYPILILRVIAAPYLRTSAGTGTRDLTALLGYGFFLLLIMRPGSQEILSMIRH